MARFTAFLDACVLVPIAPADTMLRLAERGLFRPTWSEKVINEAQIALETIHPGVDPNRFQYRFASMNEAFDDALITGWEPLTTGLALPDPGDAHVLAAAILGRADVIVTQNLKDFPSEVLSPFGIDAVSTDDFLLDQLGLSRSVVQQVIAEQAASMKAPPVDIETLLAQIARSGAPRFAHAAQPEETAP